MSEFEALPESAYPLLPIYIIALVLGSVFTLSLLGKWRERKSDTAKFITITLFFYVFAVLWLFLALLEGYITGYKMWVYRIGMGIAYGSLALSNVYMIYFVEEIFGIKRFKTKPYRIFFIILAILMVLPNNYYGYLPDTKVGFGPSIRMITSGAFIASSALLHLYIAWRTIRISRRIEDDYGRKGLLFIGLSQIAMILVYIFMIIDTMIFLFTDAAAGYSIYITLAWTMILVVITFLYLGFILPGWLKKRDEENKNDENK